MTIHPIPQPEPGDRVEIFNPYTQGWSAGFAVTEVTDGGYRVRRISDGVVLPPVFAGTRVRRAPE